MNINHVGNIILIDRRIKVTLKIFGTNKALVEIVKLLDPSFTCKCDPRAYRFRCESEHDDNCLFEKELSGEYGTYVKEYQVEYDGRKITRVTYISTEYPNGNILNGCVK